MATREHHDRHHKHKRADETQQERDKRKLYKIKMHRYGEWPTGG